MATATKKPDSPGTPSPPSGAPPKSPNIVLRGFDAVFRFLASLKLAVMSLSTLAATLIYATFFESWHGTAAVQEWIYRSKGFAVLLAFLGANILCAALIRFPWKKRQTGFVVTHAGLLLLLAGSWYAVINGDEGQVAMLEGESKEEMVRSDYPVIRVKQLDPANSHEALHEWELPFRPGAFAWGPGQPRPRSFLESLSPGRLVSRGDEGRPQEVLTRPGDPFQLVVKSHIPASVPALAHLADPAGTPMIKLRPRFKAPGMPAVRDMFPDDADRWLVTQMRIFKVVRDQAPAQLAFLFVDTPELVDDFLNPPSDPGAEGAARFHYTDKNGKPRSYDWKLEASKGKTVTLPDSDLAVTFTDLAAFPAREAGLSETLGAERIPIAQFEVARGKAEPVKHIALAGLPMFPNVIPSGEKPTDAPTRPLVSINYDPPPVLEATGNGRMGVIEVLGTPDGTLYYRVFSRPEAGAKGAQIRSKGPMKKGESVVAFGPPKSPVTISVEAEEFLAKGVEKEICEPVVLPKSQMGNGIAASLVAMTVNGEDGTPRTQEFFVRRSVSLDQAWKSVTFPGGGLYQVAYDVDRKPLGFGLKLDDFQRGFDPGTEQASRFSSQVRLTDKAAGIEDTPHLISMNEPLTHKGYTFYQSSYIREQDPRTGRETGRVQSVLQVGSNPGRSAIYGGCLLIVLGAFLQFYMRAGLFNAVSHAAKLAKGRETGPARPDDDTL